MPHICVAMTVKHIAGVAILGLRLRWYLLIELSSPNPNQNLTALLTSELGNAAAAGGVKDAMLATSLAQAQAMWKLRESVPEAQRRPRRQHQHDVSVPVSAIPRSSRRQRAGARTGSRRRRGLLRARRRRQFAFQFEPKAGADTTQFVGRTHALELAMFDLVRAWAAASASNTALVGSKPRSSRVARTRLSLQSCTRLKKPSIRRAF